MGDAQGDGFSAQISSAPYRGETPGDGAGDGALIGGGFTEGEGFGCGLGYGFDRGDGWSSSSTMPRGAGGWD